MIPFPQISPEIFSIQLFGIEFALRWYALAYLVGLLVGGRIMVALMRRPALWGDAAPMRPAQVEELLTWVILGVVLGGRLGFVLFYQPGYYLAHPIEIPMVWQGGMSFHGGFLGVVLASWWWARRNGVNPLRLADALAVVAPIGLFFGRIANFVNGELWGRLSDAPWAVVFPNGGPFARHPSQLYEAGLEGILLQCVLAIAIYRFAALKRPGLVTGLFVVGYALSRIAVEFFREPDPQLGYLFGGWLTMGMLLSLPMLALGLWAILRARAAEPVSA